MGDIYLHHSFTDTLAPASTRAYCHLIAILSRMSREDTWPRLSFDKAVTAERGPREDEKDQRPREDVVVELVNSGLLLDVDGGTITIGERISDLVRNTPPPDWEDGTLRAET